MNLCLEVCEILIIRQYSNTIKINENNKKINLIEAFHCFGQMSYKVIFNIH